MESLISRQAQLCAEIEKIKINFTKDSDSRKSLEYLKRRIEALDKLWAELDQNDEKLLTYPIQTDPYYTESRYMKTKELYQSLRHALASFKAQPIASTPTVPTTVERAIQPCGKVDELLAQQRTYFRAFNRLFTNLKLEEMEKWEIEDELRNVQLKWNNIESLHLQIDTILQGGDITYEDEYTAFESKYKSMKRVLNHRLSSTAHQQHSTPQLDIPQFTGHFLQWPTFFDLYNETIHKSTYLTKAQKMQHLKNKVRGEAERLIQHLHISDENYDTAYQILVHRYDNPQLLFTRQIEIFLEQPKIQKQTSFELKRLYDTTTECVHAIHNLGVDTTSWDPLLVHLLCKKIDSTTYADYKEARKCPRELPKLDEFMEFIENKFISLEPISKSDRDLSVSKPQPSKQPYRTFFKQETYRKPANRTFHTNAAYTTVKCPVCGDDHELYKCSKFIDMPSSLKMRTINEQQLCRNCLFKHTTKCTSNKKCKICNKPHHSAIHDAISLSLGASSVAKSAATTPRVNAPQTSGKCNVNHVASEEGEILLTTLSINVRAADGSYVNLRALLDQGSQVSLISERATQLLALQRKNTTASIFGIGDKVKQSKGLVTLNLKAIHSDYELQTDALVINQVINNLPTSSFAKQTCSHIQGVQLADPEFNVSRPVDLLLDASVYSEIILNGLIKGSKQCPIAQETKFGWILSGHINYPVKSYRCHTVINKTDDISKYWEIEDITSSSASALTEEEQNCELFYQTTTRRLENGSYVVALPMKANYQTLLGISKNKTVGQFNQLERKMSKNEPFAYSYRNFINEYQNLGHMTPTPVSNNQLRYYMPHHGIQKDDSTTTKLRVVFNASCKTSSGLSLNDVMECGPNLQGDLQAIILNWRKYRYVMTADIEKMYRTIYIRTEDQPLQMIVWRNSPNHSLQDYQLTTVTYGTKAAPYLAMRTLKQLAIDEGDKHPMAAQALQTNFYMDDYMGGADNISEAKELQHQLISLLRCANMNLRKWSSNERQLMDDLSDDLKEMDFEFKCTQTKKTLGLKWNPALDAFKFKNVYASECVKVTKRNLLSDISRIFDPLGWLSPLTIRAKILFQQTWSSDVEWDEEVSAEIQKEWLKLRADLQLIDQFTINRYLGPKSQTMQLHGFCDASEAAYAAVVYIVTENKGAYTSSLVAAKTKVAPRSKVLSLPRMELCGAVLLAHLMKKIQQTLALEGVQVVAWSDSMVVLGWLKGNIARWKQFVANRVRAITDVIPASAWRHVESKENAADCATRGVTAAFLSKNLLWWEGPEWIKNFKPTEKSLIAGELPEMEVETKKAKICATITKTEPKQHFVAKLLSDQSSLTHVKRTLAWTLRFINNCKHTSQRADGALTDNELRHALQIIIQVDQDCSFQMDIEKLQKDGVVHTSSALASLNPFLDEAGIVRVGGRLAHSQLSSSAKHGVILTSNSRLTELLITEAHKATSHGGPRLTLSLIRDKYWIMSGMRTVKRELRKCIRCRRYKAETHPQLMADLPMPRVIPSRPFTHTGIDFTGHFEIRSNKGRGVRTTKGYVSVFVCLATKAIHLELVSELSTQAFLAAFRRFCSRRGTPSHVYSDNGTNFVGANKLLRKEYKEIIQTLDETFVDNISSMEITWIFNAPSWPSAGGLWEAAVKSVKYHLKRVLGDQHLTYEEFSTLLTQIEACLNSRPLYALTEDPDDECLTPGHFLVGGQLLSRPQTEPTSIGVSKRWQLIQNMNKIFWKNWSKEYLQHLQTRSKWRTAKKNLQIDDVVLLKEDNVPPGKWPMGRVEEVHPGSDGLVRVASVKTKNKVIKRPVTKLVWLPIAEADDAQTRSNTQEKTRTRSTTQRKGKGVLANLLLTSLTILALFTSHAHASLPYNTTSLDENQALFFEKMSTLEYIKDRWNLVVYYNMTSYWQGMQDIKSYIGSWRQACPDNFPQFTSIIRQVEHDLDELKHYNKLLKYQYNRRHRRGLINGVGMVANTLFGVLDERFAQQYTEDIKKIALNENHLQTLIKNQTVILEAEYNIIKRNEFIMNNQFVFIKKHLISFGRQMQQWETENRKELLFTSSAIALTLIVKNLREIQQTLIDTVTDIKHGKIDVHLLSPDQLQTQVNIITDNIQDDLAVPIDRNNLQDLYQLIEARSSITDELLIIELKVPLISKDTFELNRIISVPHRGKNGNTLLVPTYNYLAFNYKKDLIMFISEANLATCHQIRDKTFCYLNVPIYDFKNKNSICDIKIVDAQPQSTCTTKTTPCEVGWIKLQQRNVWLYSCCETCKVRIICANDVELVALNGNGVLGLGQGCTLMTNGFAISAHNNYHNDINVSPNIIIPTFSMLNHITNITFNLNEDELRANIKSKENDDEIRKGLESIREQSDGELSIHDIHQYSISYTILAIILSAAACFIWARVRRQRRLQPREDDNDVEMATRAAAVEVPAPRPLESQGSWSAPPAPRRHRHMGSDSDVINKLCRSKSVISVGCGPSPQVRKSRDLTQVKLEEL